MRRLVWVLVLAGGALGHGESSRSAPQGKVAPVIVPTGGPTTGGGGPPTPSGPLTVTGSGGDAHEWTMWWAYNREWILAARARGTPLSGGRVRSNDELQRKQLREGELFDLMVRALGDKWHEVREAAAVALGKFKMPEADRYLTKRIHFPPEGWFTVRESCIYGMGILGLKENRKLFETIAGDKERTIKARSLALVGLLMDGTQESADSLVWHLKYHRSGIKATSGSPAVRSEQDRRRMAAHLLGFAGLEGYDDVLSVAAAGSRRFGDGVQGLAITALGRRRAKEHRAWLFRRLYKRDIDRNVRRSAPIALGMMIDRTETDEIKRLGRFVRDWKKDPIAQHFAIMALAQIGGDTAIEILDDLSDFFGDKGDRAFVHLALGLCGARSDRAKERLMIELDRRKSSAEQAVIAMALGLAGHREAVPRIIDLVEESPVDSLRWGVLALGLMGDERGVKVARKAFEKHNDVRVRESAAIALTLLEKRAAVRELVTILKEAGTLHAKAAIVTALGIQPEPTRDAIDALIDVYKDDSMPNSVRGMAIAALGALADPRIVPLSASLTRNYNYFIRCYGLDEVASLL